MSSFATTPSAGARAARPAMLLALSLLALSLVGASLLLVRPAAAASTGPVDLGTASSFAVLAGAGITNTGATTITGDVGTFPTTTRSGFGSVTLIGTDHGGDAVTQGAKDALVTAYGDAAGRTPATPLPVELGGSTLLAGVYTSPTFGLTGTLTLDAQGRADAQFIFQAGSTLITEANSRVVLRGGADPCRVVWQVGSSATFKTGTQFTGDVLAYTSITAQTSATFLGRLLARNGAVTLDTNTISNSACAAATAGSTPTLTPTATPTPTPTSTATATATPTSTSTPTPTPIPTPTASPTPSPTPTTVLTPPPTPTPTSTATGTATPTSSPTAVATVANPVVPAVGAVTGGQAQATGTGTSGRVGDHTPSTVLLPRTGLRTWLAITGFALLVLGSTALAAGWTTRPVA